jgi:hypothetical protein
MGWQYLCAIAAALVSVSAAAQPSNLSTCLDGRYPTLCNRALLTIDQRALAEAAERRENLKTCLNGRYPSLCRRPLLTADEASRVDMAERRENLATCLTGRYPSLCRRHLLSSEDVQRVAAAERRENLATCMTGLYPTLCQKQLLTAEEAQRVRQAEEAAANRRQATLAQAPAPSTAPSRSRRFGSAGCEAGHWVRSVSDAGRIVVLQDGSVWEIDPIDRIDTMLWLPTDDIVVCGDRLINTDDNETASGRRLR